jgi:hypothetical protein
VGWPGVPDHVSLWGLLIPIRRAFRQYVNLRSIRVFPGVPSPVRGAAIPDADPLNLFQPPLALRWTARSNAGHERRAVQVEKGSLIIAVGWAGSVPDRLVPIDALVGLTQLP